MIGFSLKLPQTAPRWRGQFEQLAGSTPAIQRTVRCQKLSTFSSSQKALSSSFAALLILSCRACRAKRRRVHKTLRAMWTQNETNEVVAVVNGIRHRRLGGTDIAVSELALGTQRWLSDDFNAPSEELCHAFLDRGVLESGLNLIHTAESYPMYPGWGATEETIGRWLYKDPGRREKVVLASMLSTKPRTYSSILSQCESSLRRLGTDYLDVYLLHGPARYTPFGQGQNMEYDWDHAREVAHESTSFDDIVEAMGVLLRDGKIRGYGACNDNAVGLMGMAEAARRLGVPGPCCMQHDYSLLNRRIEENGLSEASSPAHNNAGFMAYSVLGKGMLTGKYGFMMGDADEPPPPALDDPDEDRMLKMNREARGRLDRKAWSLMSKRFRSRAARAAMARYKKLAEDYGLTLTQLALRFVAGRAAVTTSIVAHTSMEQLEETIHAFRDAANSPLDPQLRWEIDRVHLLNRLPLFCNDELSSDKRNLGDIEERLP